MSAPKKQKAFYSGKKKRHTLKTQVVVDKKNKKIMCVSVAKGRMHDFALLKRSKVTVKSETEIGVDAGYQGLQLTHPKTVLPKKNTKLKRLSKADKKANR